MNAPAYEGEAFDRLSGAEVRALLAAALRDASDGFVTAQPGWRVASAWAYADAGQVTSSVAVAVLAGWIIDHQGGRVPCWWEVGLGMVSPSDDGPECVMRVIPPGGRGFEQRDADEMKRQAEERFRGLEAARARHAEKQRAAKEAGTR